MTRRVQPEPHSDLQFHKKERCAFAIKGDMTLSQLRSTFDVHPNQITAWKALLQEGAADLFGPEGPGFRTRRPSTGKSASCEDRGADARNDFLEGGANTAGLLTQSADRPATTPADHPAGVCAVRQRGTSTTAACGAGSPTSRSCYVPRPAASGISHSRDRGLLRGLVAADGITDRPRPR